MGARTVRVMIRELQASGLSCRQIARACGCHKNTIHLISTGQTLDPLYSLGRAIEDLHATLCTAQRVVSVSSVEWHDG